MPILQDFNLDETASSDFVKQETMDGSDSDETKPIKVRKPREKGVPNSVRMKKRRSLIGPKNVPPDLRLTNEQNEFVYSSMRRVKCEVCTLGFQNQKYLDAHIVSCFSPIFGAMCVILTISEKQQMPWKA